MYFTADERRSIGAVPEIDMVEDREDAEDLPLSDRAHDATEASTVDTNASLQPPSPFLPEPETPLQLQPQTELSQPVRSSTPISVQNDGRAEFMLQRARFLAFNPGGSF